MMKKKMRDRINFGEDKLISYDTLLKDIQNTITEDSTFFDWMNLIYRQPQVVLDIFLDCSKDGEEIEKE